MARGESLELDVGGDWFDAVTLADGRLGLVVGDVVGKGVQAAASMGQLRNALRAESGRLLRTEGWAANAELLARTNEAPSITSPFGIPFSDSTICSFDPTKL